jgi:hypothetical protein
MFIIFLNEKCIKYKFESVEFDIIEKTRKIKLPKENKRKQLEINCIRVSTCLVLRWEPTNVRLNTLNVVSIFWRLFGSHLQTWFLVLKSILAEATICSFYVCLNRFHFIHLLIFQLYPFVWYLPFLLLCYSVPLSRQDWRRRGINWPGVLIRLYF